MRRLPEFVHHIFIVPGNPRRKELLLDLAGHTDMTRPVDYQTTVDDKLAIGSGVFCFDAKTVLLKMTMKTGTNIHKALTFLVW